MMTEPETCCKATPETDAVAQYSYNDDGYRVRNLWIDVFMGAYHRGLPAEAAADAADTAVARYNVTFGVK